MKLRREEGGGHVPPPHRRGGRRLVATLILGVGAAGVALLGRGGSASPSATTPTPFVLSHPAVSPDHPEVLLYVTETCPWCRLELQAWDSLLMGAEAKGPRVVLAPDTDARHLLRLAPSLATRAHLDADGSMGRALGVGAVPFLARMEPGGWVREVRVGLSTSHERLALLSFLNPPPESPKEAPR